MWYGWAGEMRGESAFIKGRESGTVEGEWTLFWDKDEVFEKGDE